MTSLVLDTHAVVWYLAAPAQLSPAARRAVTDTSAAGESLFLPSISIVELIYLIEKGRIPHAVLDLIIRELDDPSSPLRLVPLDLSIARSVEKIPWATVPDMPDRVIAATALHLDLPLDSRDCKIQAAAIQTIW